MNHSLIFLVTCIILVLSLVEQVDFNEKSEENNLNERLRAFPSFRNVTPLCITMAGITDPDPSYRVERARSRVAVVEYVVDGVGYIKGKNSLYTVGKGQVYLLHPEERHEYYADASFPYTKIFLNASGPLAEQLLISYELTGKQVLEGASVRECFETVASLVESSLPDEVLQSRLQGLFVEILSRLSLACREGGYSEEALRLKRCLDEGIHRHVRASELASVIFRSTDYCLKLFRREFGITPYAYQLEQKMILAKTLLRDTRLSVGEIAAYLGYSDLHYFSNLFEKKCGLRPLSYRKKGGLKKSGENEEKKDRGN